ncbi:MAG: hypothetical protein K0R28_6711, partial [Paenibacillus sp.]|nr:hypothetical protein [Paenibacillus sp.]
PYLTAAMARRWSQVAARVMNLAHGEWFAGEKDTVTRGQFLNALYAFLREARRR